MLRGSLLNTMKKVKQYIPETYLILTILYYWFLTANLFNWFAIVLLAVVATLIISKSNVFGVILSLVLILIDIYLFFALMSEFSEFKTFNSSAKELLFFGFSYLTLNLIFFGLLFLKHSKLLTNRTTENF